MTITTPTARYSRPPAVTLELAPGLNPRRGESFADALFCSAAGHADGIEQHKQAEAERRRLAVPATLLADAKSDLERATSAVREALVSGKAKEVKEALRARFDAAQEVELLSWRPPLAGRPLATPAQAALAQGIADRQELVSVWCLVVSQAGWITPEQASNGVAYIAKLAEPIIARAEQAEDLLSDPNRDTSPVQRKHATAAIEYAQGLRLQAETLAGITPNTSGARI